jgi:ribosomal protein S18 acetylase RimI-like enzyme
MLVTEDLIRRLEESEAMRLATIGRTASGDVMPWGGGQAVCVGADNPYSQCTGAGLEGPIGEEEFIALDQFFAAHGSEVEMKVCPIADTTFRQMVLDRAERLHEFESILIREPSLSTPDWPSEIEIREVGRGEEELYARTVLTGFFTNGYPDALMEAAKASCRTMNAIGYIAYIDDEVAGAASLGVACGIVSLQGGSVLPEFRRRGVHQALQLARVQAARKFEPSAITMSAEPGSVSHMNAQKLGFEVAYTRPAFKWHPKP